MRQPIKYYEESNFTQTCDNDFEAKKNIWNKDRLKGKTGHDFHEERGYQKFK